MLGTIQLIPLTAWGDTRARNLCNLSGKLLLLYGNRKVMTSTHSSQSTLVSYFRESCFMLLKTASWESSVTRNNAIVWPKLSSCRMFQNAGKYDNSRCRQRSATAANQFALLSRFNWHKNVQQISVRWKSATSFSNLGSKYFNAKSLHNS